MTDPTSPTPPGKAPDLHKASRRANHPLVVAGSMVFTLLVVFIVLGGGALWIGKERYYAPGPLAEDKAVIVPNDYGVMDIAELLLKQGVIDDKWVFVGAALGTRASGKLKAGEYAFAGGASIQQVLSTIVSGKVIEYTVTIPEGLTSDQIVERVLEVAELSGGVRQVPREGSLMPDTYRITRGTSREDLLRRMARTQDATLKEIWEKRDPELPLKSPDELVILASIVEKETGVPEERTEVAAVFVNRLNRKMRLQSDPTIIYGLVRGKGRLERPLTRTDISTPTPFNTYTIPALPPGPIGNPGRASLEATARPAKTKNLYFVADGSGGHAFAETLDQHNKNVARWRQVERERKVDPSSLPAGTSGTTGATAVD
ncbi:endolytic transglycosylase MltG [Ancylobacter dichloromethanicus]|uniref:Endolytic murein transglycosylase n=1 Tax=Ancylobacter dichloromethanicus TaxID=518825 RepID=A0A9W6J8G8_9HYPH|nr:endolytic transglycosylase MltG [Ancylobacter dichloromethanicus]MBS7555724.1 endolytic transglycosylase MltG [Ancylobacter dichloromethanicus]GLK72795.1 aminodeoxychorismate lyase [Ancylobacter dichloromethanicus]